MPVEENSGFTFHKGHYKFHEDTGLNFQFNRMLRYGGKLEEIEEVSKKIKDYRDWKGEMVSLAERALSKGRLENAAAYYRAAEFFTMPGDKDKEIFYEKFIDLFNEVHGGDAIERYQVPYESGFLPAIWLRSAEKKDTIVIHGGFDSFMEEFYEQAKFINSLGYEVILFEGPGQGAAMRKHHLPMTHEWEKPVGKILDYFNAESVTLIGISLGGYLAIRAAAFDQRVARVIAFDVLYDFFNVLTSGRGKRAQKMLRFLLSAKASFLTNRVLKGLMKKDLLVDWGMTQGIMVTGKSSPYAFLKATRDYTAENISEKVVQDVLLLAGNKDHFVPLEMLYAQMRALKNARSITCRIFTEKEDGQDHCQVGNEKLAFEVMERWIEQAISSPD
jgi:pimeloyl-ACP methyl ester carboxylesterase